jgi:hypothetical protein
MEVVIAEDVPILIQNWSQSIFDIEMYLSWNKCSVLHLPRNHSMVRRTEHTRHRFKNYAAKHRPSTR